MSFELAIFVVLGTLAIAASLVVVLHSHPVYSALALVVALFQLALLFVSLDAHAIAFLQIIVYAGAIMVLFLFVIMLLNLQREPTEKTPSWRAVALTVAAVLAVELGTLVLSAPVEGPVGAAAPGYGSFRALGGQLFTAHAVSFEVTSVLLLVAVIGAVVLAKRGVGEP